MDDARSDRIGRLFEEALSLPPSGRDAFLDGACEGDDELRAELVSLLDRHDEAPDDLEDLAARLLPEAIAAATEAMSDDPLVGSRLGRYEILDRRGSGGMAVVYRARDRTLERTVALKLLPPSLSADEESRARFLAEARAASALDHPNIGVVHEVGSFAPEGGGPARLYIAMAYYEGETLAERLGRGPLSVREAVDIGRQVAAGLAAAHGKAIVHRDIKPANLLITPQGVAKIVDFGVAKLLERTGITRTGASVGTVAYMSPEQAAGEAVDARSDIWSLGVVLYEALTGRRPFRSGDQRALIHAILDGDPEPLAGARPDALPGLIDAVSRCLEKNPHRRFQTADALEAALSTAAADLAGGSARARAPGGPARTVTPFRIAGAAAALLALGALGFGLYRAGAPPTRVEGGSPTLAILPPVPVGGDTALARLADELVVTLSANLTGLGNLAIVDAISILAHAEDGREFGFEGGGRLARDLGASAFVIGTLRNAGPEVRLEFQVHRTADGALLDRGAVDASPDDPGSMADTAAFAILDAVWEEGDPPAPNRAAISTSSVPALRAYLRGERAFARGSYGDAIEAFEEAFAIDSTFWFAYWRSLYPRSHVLERPADPELVEKVREHRAELPTQDRLLVESGMGATLTERLDLLERLVLRYPHYWPAWWAYANTLVHWGPYVGRTAADSRVALERVVALNPGFATGWDHLFWMAEVEHDTALAERAMRRVLAIQAGDEARAEYRELVGFRYEVLRSGLEHPDTLATVATWLRAHPQVMEMAVWGLAASWMPRAQHRLNERLLALGQTARVTAAIEGGNALAWVARGAWDSALVAVDRWRRVADAAGGLEAYGLVVTGAALGVLAPEEARRRRPAPSVGGGGPEDPGVHEDQLAWLDGVLAHAEDDADGLSRSIEHLGSDPAATPGGSPRRDALRRSLHALRTEATGDREAAAEELVSLERELADRFATVWLTVRHPYVSSLHRVLAARWLRELGDEARAGELLTWYESVPGARGPWITAHQVGLGVITLLDRAEIAEALGSEAEARRLYVRFLELFDQPAPSIEPMIGRAHAGLERLGPP